MANQNPKNGKKPTAVSPGERLINSTENIDVTAERRAVESERKKVEGESQRVEVQRKKNEAENQRLEALRKKTEDDRKELNADRKTLESEKATLVLRKKELQNAEIDREAGYAAERAKQDETLFETRKEALKEIDEIKATRLAEIWGEINQERDAWIDEKKRIDEQTRNERNEVELKRGLVSAQLDDIARRTAELQEAERNLESEGERLRDRHKRRSDNLDEEVERRVSELVAVIKDNSELIKKTNENEISNLQDLLEKSRSAEIGIRAEYDELKQSLGGNDINTILRQLKDKEIEIKRLEKELANRPTDDLQSKYESLRDLFNQQKNQNDNLEEQITANSLEVAEVKNIKRKAAELEAELESANRKAAIYEGSAKEAEAELQRYRAAYESPTGAKARYEEIEKPFLKLVGTEQPQKDDALEELTWLKGIEDSCNNYGLHFNPRLLKAFHTALKTAEFSPLTVLAGVSGTGKSELPRLYSHFGGLFFNPVAVQPNWDSQESMLGFFNTIDNRFDAQPLLHFLAQSQKEWSITENGEGYPGLQTGVCLVLLDEMNLAHPELYFAEFLSKLELRRGMKGKPPQLPVKIGSGHDPFMLDLGRNVLWAGTMNQDETTKSLSDKVLDRSIVIHFPRPMELKRRKELAPLDENNRGRILHRKTWQKWWSREIEFTDDEIRPFKGFIEEMNNYLGVAGRAIGHRAWQSVEYYMSNYPDVRAAADSTSKTKAMHDAFEDQLVQKVMPKLRGIDTRGKSKDECLDKIRQQLLDGIGGNRFNLTEDFDLACELGYGQFIWQSANYLKDEQKYTIEVNEAAQTAGDES